MVLLQCRHILPHPPHKWIESHSIWSETITVWQWPVNDKRRPILYVSVRCHIMQQQYHCLVRECRWMAGVSLANRWIPNDISVISFQLFMYNPQSSIVIATLCRIVGPQCRSGKSSLFGHLIANPTTVHHSAGGCWKDIQLTGMRSFRCSINWVLFTQAECPIKLIWWHP